MKLFFYCLLLLFVLGVSFIALVSYTYDRFIRYLKSDDYKKKYLEETLQCTFSDAIEMERMYFHFGDAVDVVNYRFWNYKDWEKVLHFINAIPNPRIRYYRCYREKGNYYDACYIDTERRLLQIDSGLIGGIGVPDEEKKYTDWQIHPEEKFYGIIKNEFKLIPTGFCSINDTMQEK